MVTAIATRGLFSGAKPMNQGWVRPDPAVPTEAVPVLPANSIPPPSWAGVPVPSSTTFFIICATAAAVEGFITWAITWGGNVCTV